jgi:hypothetical protein
LLIAVKRGILGMPGWISPGSAILNPGDLGALVRVSTSGELKAHITGEITKWNGVREKAGIEQL